MTAASQDIVTTKLGTDEIPAPSLLSLPMEANKIIYGGTAVASNASGNAVDVGDATALIAWGRAERQVNNLSTNAPYGAAGAQQMLIRPGVYYYVNDGSISAANVGQACFFVDNQTVSLSAAGASAVRLFAGIIQPPGAGQTGISFATNTQVPVFVGFPSGVGIELRYTVAIPLATIQAQTSGTAFNVGFPLPANARLNAAEINVATAITGGAISAVTASLSGGSDAAATIIAATTVFTGAAPVIANPGTNPYTARGGQQIKMVLTSTGGALSTATAGSLSVDLFYTIVP